MGLVANHLTPFLFLPGAVGAGQEEGNRARRLAGEHRSCGMNPQVARGHVARSANESGGRQTMSRMDPMARAAGCAALPVLWLCFALMPLPGHAQDLKPFAFVRDFEDGAALDIKPTVANGKYTVNFMGVTDEKAFAGAKSFKLQITAESGNYYAWLI